MSDLKKQIAALDRDRARLASATPQIPPPLRDAAYVPSRPAPQAPAGPHVGSRTPWGAADHVEKLADGIWQVGTPSHGGVKLSASRNRAVPDYMRASSGWYEEDCEWSVPATVFPDAFKPESREHAKKTLRNWKPDAYEKFYGVTLAPGESHMKDDRNFMAAHASDWLGVSASGDWKPGVPKGFVLVTAARGGRHRDGTIPTPTRDFLVPKAEYDVHRRHDFVVDPSRHQEVR